MDEENSMGRKVQERVYYHAEVRFLMRLVEALERRDQSHTSEWIQETAAIAHALIAKLNTANANMRKRGTG